MQRTKVVWRPLASGAFCRNLNFRKFWNKSPERAVGLSNSKSLGSGIVSLSPDYHDRRLRSLILRIRPAIQRSRKCCCGSLQNT